MDAQKCDMCRLCLASINGCDEMLLNENHDLTQSILLITGLEVPSDLGQREYICSQCLPLLEQCVEFRITCIKNDGVYREMMTGPDYVEDCGPKFQKPDTNQQGIGSLCYEVKQEFEKPVVEYIKQEPVDLGELPNDINEASENDHVLPQEDDEPSVEQAKSVVDYNDDPKLIKTKKKYPRKAVQCPQCGKVMGTWKLSEHLETHNPNRKKLCCPHCPKEYLVIKGLREHILAVHTLGVQYACEQCGKSYTTRHSFLEHQVAIHSGEKRYACSICGERFARQSMRSYHQRTAHSTLRPFACEYCDRTFKTKSHLNDHIRSHIMGKRKSLKKRPLRDTSKISSEQQEPSVLDQRNQ